LPNPSVIFVADGITTDPGLLNKMEAALEMSDPRENAKDLTADDVVIIEKSVSALRHRFDYE
jgi:hypothetical protein